MPKANTLTVQEFAEVVRKTDGRSKDALLIALFSLSCKDRPDLMQECFDAITEDEK